MVYIGVISQKKIKREEFELESLLNPFIDTEVQKIEEQPLNEQAKTNDQIRSHLSLKERYREVENAEKLYQLFYSG